VDLPFLRLYCCPGCKGISGNEKADNAAKESLDEEIQNTEKYPPQDLVKWITQQERKNNKKTWEQTNSEMKNRIQLKARSNITSTMARKEQIVIAGLPTLR
jgi:hypothetical protein